MAALSRRLLFQAVNNHRAAPVISAISSRNYAEKTGPTKTKKQLEAIASSKYGGRNRVTMLTGDGVGAEVLQHVQTVHRYAGAPIDFELVEINNEKTDEESMRHALLSVQRNGVALKGNIETKLDDPTFQSMNVRMRLDLDLWANRIKCKSIPGLECRHQNVDIVIIRENTEGEYSSLEHEGVPGIVESLKVITAPKSERIARYAFNFAVKFGRKKVTAIHKANIMKLTDGLFLESCRKVSKEFPDIQFTDMIVDNATMQMVSNPQQFDVLVMPNLYGNILSSIGAGLVGGSGVVPGMNVGDTYAVFEPGTRHSGQSLRGKNIANPVAMLLASCEMLDYLGHHAQATLIRESVLTVVARPEHQTPDLGGKSTTTETVQAIVDEIKPKTRTKYQI